MDTGWDMSAEPFVLGIAGGSGSGKSTLCKQIVGLLADRKVVVMPMDHYFLADCPQMVGPVNGQVYIDHNSPASFDLLGLIDDLDAHLCAGSAHVIIVEGLMVLQHAPLRRRLDLGVFIDAPADERIVRRLKRDMARGRTYDWTAEFYLESVRHRHNEFVEPSRWHADLVLNGTHPSERGLAAITDWVLGHSGPEA